MSACTQRTAIEKWGLGVGRGRSWDRSPPVGGIQGNSENIQPLRPSRKKIQCENEFRRYFAIRLRRGLGSRFLVSEPISQADDEVRACLMEVALKAVSMGFAEEFQARNVDRPAKLPSTRMGMNQRGEQLK